MLCLAYSTWKLLSNRKWLFCHSQRQLRSAPSMAGFPRGEICFSTIWWPPPLDCSHANCCTALTFNLRLHMHGQKPTSDAFRPPSHLIFFFFFLPFPLLKLNPVMWSACRLSLSLSRMSWHAAAWWWEVFPRSWTLICTHTVYVVSNQWLTISYNIVNFCSKIDMVWFDWGYNDHRWVAV